MFYWTVFIYNCLCWFNKNKLQLFYIIISWLIWLCVCEGGVIMSVLYWAILLKKSSGQETKKISKTHQQRFRKDIIDSTRVLMSSLFTFQVLIRLNQQTLPHHTQHDSLTTGCWTPDTTHHTTNYSLSFKHPKRKASLCFWALPFHHKSMNM